MKFLHLPLLLLTLILAACSPSQPVKSKIEIKTAPEQLFLCVTREVTQAEIIVFAGEAIEPLFETAKKAGLQPNGDLQFICPQWKGVDAKSQLYIALPVAEEKPVPTPYLFWKAPLYKCAWRDHRGSMATLKTAWEKFHADILAQGLKPTGGWREIYKYFETPESENDLTELQMGVE